MQTPREYAEKIFQEFQQEHPDLEIDSVTAEIIVVAMSHAIASYQNLLIEEARSDFDEVSSALTTDDRRYLQLDLFNSNEALTDAPN